MLDQPIAYHYDITTPQLQVQSTIDCLQHTYGIDPESTLRIMQKLLPLIENTEYQSVLDAFIETSLKWRNEHREKQTAATLPEDDGVLQASNWHEVLFESPSIRVLWGESQPGDYEPFHTHRWKSLMVIIQAGTYQIEHVDGFIERDLWPIGMYELPAETSPLAYTNIGTTSFKALRFEFKE